MADSSAVRLRRRRTRRRRRIAAGLCFALVAAGVGTAWAVRGPGGPAYRLASVTRGDVEQTVDADGTLSASGTRTASFASAGTVSSVPVKVGDTVRTGERLATIDPSQLKSNVASARSTLAQARQRLADDEQAQQTGTTTSSNGSPSSTAATTTALTTSSLHVRLLAAVTPSAPPSGGSTVADLRRAQAAVVAAQRKLDAVVAAQDDDVDALAKACATSPEATPETYTTTAGTDTTVTGSTGAQDAVVTLEDTNGDLAQTTSTNPQTVGSGTYTYRFAGLTADAAYTVSIVRSAQVKATDCAAAVSTVTGEQQVIDAATSTLDQAITALGQVIATLTTGSIGSTGPGSPPTSGPTPAPTPGRTSAPTSQPGSQPSSARHGSVPSGSAASQPNTAAPVGGSGSGAAQSVTITAAQVAADAKAIDAAKAALAVQRAALRTAVLRSPIRGTAAAVTITKGDQVSAGSSSSTITVVGDGTLSVTVDIGINEIDLVKTGQHAQVTVDGRAHPLPATVTQVGVTNTSSSSGSSSTYAVSVQLDKRYRRLYDGMGVSVAIEVGHATDVLTVPVSAVHTTGTLTTVTVLSGGTTSAKIVKVGLVGATVAEIESGLREGDQVVLADLKASIPSSDTTSTRRGSLTGLTGGGAPGGFTGGGPPGGFRPGG